MVLRAGDVLVLRGPMGAGKTTFVRGLAAAMGIGGGLVSSPTYVVMNLYPGVHGRADIAHLDCSRLGSEEELESIGWDRVVGRAIVVVEWGERIAGALSGLKDVAELVLTPTGERSRSAMLRVPESWRERAGIGGVVGRTATHCPVTGVMVSADSPSWPFASERARMADLHGWLTERYRVSRPVEQADVESSE